MDLSALREPRRWMIYMLATFPLVDYFLHIYPWGIIGGSWDKIVFLFLAFYALRKYMVEGKPSLYPTHRYLVFMVVLGLVYILMDVDYIVVALAGYRVDFWYMLYALLLPFVVEKEDVIPLLRTIAFTGFLMSLHGVYQYIIKAPIPPQWVDITQHVRTRVYSLFGSPNIFGDYAAFVTPISAAIALYEKERAQRLFYGFGALLSAATLVFTDTRAAWLSFFIGAMVFTWLLDRRMAVITFVIAVLAALFVPPIHARLGEFFTPVYWSKTFANGRISEAERAFDQMRANPLFGAGLGRYGGAIASRYFGVIYVDNYYAKTLAEIGLLGLFTFVALIFVYLRDVFRVVKRTVNRRKRIVFIGAYVGIVIVAINNLFENVFEVPDMNALFWLTGSLLLIYAAKGGLSDEES
ncbi:O-antigen ligase family protein [Ferroacidibacillus organovorans]|uniref:O-antigen ligase-related domain-containing protein n=1 Tax=Ferroacidibacillus organovorans TaxID=1765683 RepID=A0A101XPN5_9BACL|nr:O-antigen ligase family protein [Ferroacidibacillus organovorans]KUO95092.1 hypothetical protein ATW55_11500 [Ferroacidibacillus organovorans]